MTKVIARDTVSYCPDCGFTSKRTTRGLARHGLRLHSCQRWHSLAAQKARGDVQRAAVDHTARPCNHLHARHQHGDYRTYVLDSCRCNPCRAAKTAYERRRHRQQGYGTWQPYIDAEPARQHVTNLQTAGLGLKRIAAMAGISTGTLSKLMYGVRRADGSRTPSQRLRPETAAALLAVTADVDALGATVNVDGTGTRRRLQALISLGYAQAELARRIGMSGGNFGRTLTSDHVYAATARTVRDVYDSLHATRPLERNKAERQSASRARNHATANGYLGPGWWDDDTIDDPTYEPSTEPHDRNDIDPVAIERAIAGHNVDLTRAERTEAMRQLHDAGISTREIARRLQVHDRQVWRDLVERPKRAAS